MGKQESKASRAISSFTFLTPPLGQLPKKKRKKKRKRNKARLAAGKLKLSCIILDSNKDHIMASGVQVCPLKHAGLRDIPWRLEAGVKM